MAIEYSEGSKDLLEEIVRINYKIFNGMYESEPYSLKHYQQKLSNVGSVIYVAKSHNVVIADAISFERNNSLYLWVLGVSNNFRNQGIASKLFELTEQYAKNHGFDFITTKVCNISRGMLRALIKRGYNIVNVEEHEKDPRYNAVHFRFELK
jgi:ribosomal protein S18 acetylase RimI-like enzyme